MTENPDYCCEKRKSGSILLELNFLFMIIVLVSGVYFHTAHVIFKSYKTILADLEILRAARYTESILRRELSYLSTQVRLSKDLMGRDQLICQKILQNVRCDWYVSNKILYRRTSKEVGSGINPYSYPEVQIIDFKIIPLANNRLGILMTLKHLETGMIRKYPITLFLNNGDIVR